MTIEKHSLHNEFPEMATLISDLKTSDTHFARLFNDYDQVEHEVHKIETGSETVADTYLEDLKKRRLQLKDQLYGILKANSKPKESCCGCCGG